MKRRLNLKSFVLVALTLLAACYEPKIAEAQTGGLRREPGIIMGNSAAPGGVGGQFAMFTCGGTIAAGNLVYLSSTGTVLVAPISGAQNTTIVGFAYRACVAAASVTPAAPYSTTPVQLTGIVNAIADATVNPGDYVGAPTTAAGRVLTLSTPISDPRMIIGRSVSAAAVTVGNTVQILLNVPSGPLVGGGLTSSIATAATIAPTVAQCGSLIHFGATAGSVVTLPVPPTTPCSFDFVIDVTNTSASNEIRTDSSSTFLAGTVMHSASGIAPLAFRADGTSTQALKMAGTGSSGVTGGYINSRFHVQSISATQWEISGENECVTVCTTAFTATP